MEQHKGKIHSTKFVLATDIDDTLLGDAKALAQLNHWLKLNRQKILLVYLTGRYRESALRVIKDEHLLWPDILVTDVGAQICYPPDYEPDSLWHQYVLDGWRPGRIVASLKSWPQLLLQPVPSELRLSYFIPSNTEANKLAEAIRSRLKEQNLAAKIVISRQTYLDILPPQAGKGSALAYLRHRHNWNPRLILVCGDSGNDIDMLTLGFPAVLVGNASCEIKEIQLPPNVYRARAPFAAGIWEGLKRLNLVEPDPYFMR